jgi:hypothetical protein
LWRRALVQDFLADGERLIHGNELLVEHDPEYPRDMRRVSQHTLAKVFDVLEAQAVEIPSGLELPKAVRTSADLDHLKHVAAGQIGSLKPVGRDFADVRDFVPHGGDLRYGRVQTLLRIGCTAESVACDLPHVACEQ